MPNLENIKKRTVSKTTTTNDSSDQKLEYPNKRYHRSKKRQVYSAEEDSTSNISSKCDDDSDYDTDALVEICNLCKGSIGMAIPSESRVDSGSLSHISDQPVLFTIFEPIIKQIIKVDGYHTPLTVFLIKLLYWYYDLIFFKLSSINMILKARQILVSMFN
jgi:hypothetical protein